MYTYTHIHTHFGKPENIHGYEESDKCIGVTRRKPCEVWLFCNLTYIDFKIHSLQKAFSFALLPTNLNKKEKPVIIRVLSREQTVVI